MNKLSVFFNWLNRSIKFLVVGNNTTISTEQINSNTFLFSGFLISSISCIFNFIEGFNLALSIFTVFSSLLLIVLYYLSRFRNRSNIWLSAISVLSLLSVSWFMNGGGIGSTSFMYVYAVIVLSIMAERHQQNGLFLLIMSNILVLYGLEYFAGDVLVRPYSSSINHYSDNTFVFIVILMGVFFTTRFIKRSYDKERNLVKMKTQELEISNEKRTNTFINLAHETKTPLTLITAYLDEYIRKNKKEEDESLLVLKNTIGNLSRDIVNFFDMEKIQKGILMYDHNQVVDFGKLLENSIRLFAVIAGKKNIELIAHIPTDILVHADPGCLVRIINNLIENSIKYTEANGKIEVMLSVNEQQVNFSVKDSGLGIPSSLHDKIFEPYFQINSEKANFQGMGLGLSITKKLIDQLNGRITVESDRANEPGTKITVSLPLWDRNQVGEVIESVEVPFYFDIEKRTIQEEAFDENKFSILIVEDDVSLLNYVVTALQKNYNVYYAVSGEEAVEKLRNINRLDLIISDVMMDQGDGFFLFKQVLASKRLNHIPFIFLTARFSNSDRIEGLTLGAIDYICKPFRVDELDKKIQAILNAFVNQRNMILTNAYNAMLLEKDLPVLMDVPIDLFESNCSKHRLTSRERDVIRLMIDGKIHKEIAAILNISTDTVKTHVRNSYEKVGVGNKMELIKKLAG